jgi:hypothetical protein
MRERVTAIATAWPTEKRARRYAASIVRQLERYRGEYDISSEMTGARRYTPGDRGRGELQQVSLAAWRGVGLRRSFFRYFHGSRTSGTAFGGRFVLRRGRYVCDVAWTARTQATDRRLSHLPARLVGSLS